MRVADWKCAKVVTVNDLSQQRLEGNEPSQNGGTNFKEQRAINEDITLQTGISSCLSFGGTVAGKIDLYRHTGTYTSINTMIPV
jgi:hypothetical protein